MPVFEMLRVSLARKSEAPLLQGLQLPEPVTRAEFLSAALTRRHNFVYRRKPYVFDPFLADESAIAGGITKRDISLLSRGPDQDWEVAEEEDWPLSLVIFDAREGAQIALVQVNSRIGSPRRVLLALLESLASEPEFRTWKPYVEYVSDPQNFWEAARDNVGKVTSISFKFIPPNALFGTEKVDDLIRAARTEANSDSTEIRLRNASGNLRPEGELISASLDTATRGGGSAEMKSGRRTIYSSSKNRKLVEVGSDELPIPSAVEKIRSLARKMIGITYD